MTIETVVSPTDIVFSNTNNYDSWWRNNNYASGEGSLRFYNSNGLTTSTLALKMRNKLWYILQDTASTIYRAKITSLSFAFIRAVSGTTLHNLWHHRLCHAGKFCTNNIDKVADGVPCLKRRNPLFSCHAWNSGKMTKQIKGHKYDPLRAKGPGRRFNMDFGFVRVKSVTKGEDGPLITFRDRYNYYLLIDDEYSPYLWIFLFANKKNPVVTVAEFLSNHGAKHGLRWIRTD